MRSRSRSPKLSWPICSSSSASSPWSGGRAGNEAPAPGRRSRSGGRWCGVLRLLQRHVGRGPFAQGGRPLGGRGRDREGGELWVPRAVEGRADGGGGSEEGG